MSAKPKRTANPFEQLMGAQVIRKPGSTAAVVVINGRRVQTAGQALQAAAANDPGAAPDDVEEARRLALEVRNAKARAHYQQRKKDPEFIAMRREYYRRNRERLRAYKRAYDQEPANREAARASNRAYAKRKRLEAPEVHRQQQREYYYRHRDEILARKKAKAAAARAAKTED